MTFPSINADEHAQVPWPEPSSPLTVRDPVAPANGNRADPERQGASAAGPTGTTAKSGEKRMNWKDFVNISISMAGAQIAWTLELGYGTYPSMMACDEESVACG